MDYFQLMSVWESSVKATHHFLKAEDFKFYKNILPDYFPCLDMYVLRLQDEIIAFMGLSGERLEMLFVSAKSRGMGCGRVLMEHAISRLGVTKVDVNEQNHLAVGFYEKFGCRVVDRSEKDSMEKNYPILHLSL